MTTVYYILKLLTFPGAVTRAFWEQVVCRISGIPVEDSRYLQMNEMCGHIEHMLAEKPRGAFALCYVPRFMNVLLALIVGSFSATRIFYLGVSLTLLSMIDIAGVWFAFSLLTNCSPMWEDALNMWSLVYSKKSNIFQKIFYFPGAVVSVAWAFLDKYSRHFLIGAAVLVYAWIAV
ncbi:MAG: hypothetical protein MJ177_05160 [Clostridia bacterium]|nr:hypothetical protein [Clostridia bacterium]